MDGNKLQSPTLAALGALFSHLFPSTLQKLPRRGDRSLSRASALLRSVPCARRRKERKREMGRWLRPAPLSRPTSPGVPPADQRRSSQDVETVAACEHTAEYAQPRQVAPVLEGSSSERGRVSGFGVCREGSRGSPIPQRQGTLNEAAFSSLACISALSSLQPPQFTALPDASASNGTPPAIRQTHSTKRTRQWRAAGWAARHPRRTRACPPLTPDVLY